MQNHIVVVLDRSGSMSAVWDDAIGGFNSFLSDQHGDNPDDLMSLLLFDHDYVWRFQRTRLGEVQRLNRQRYVPRGTTALFDALGRACVETLEAQQGREPSDPDETDDPLGHARAMIEGRQGQTGERVIVAVLTDGHENSSKDWSYEQLQKLMDELQERQDWRFVFLAADPKGFDQVAGLSSHVNTMSAQYKGDAQGTRSAYDTISTSVSESKASPDESVKSTQEGVGNQGGSG